MKEYDYTYEDTWERRSSQIGLIGTSYAEFLLSDHWKTCVAKANTRTCYDHCEFCNRKRDHLHHATYKHLGTKSELMGVYPVCKEHHQMIHELSKESKLSVRLVTLYFRNPNNHVCNKHIKKLNPGFYDMIPPYLEKYGKVNRP